MNVLGLSFAAVVIRGYDEGSENENMISIGPYWGGGSGTLGHKERSSRESTRNDKPWKVVC